MSTSHEQSGASFFDPIVHDPPLVKLKNHPDAAWFFTDDHTDLIERNFNKAGLNPQSYPYALDLASGAGQVAFWLRNGLKYKPKQVVCVDKRKYDANLVPECERICLDILLMGRALLDNPDVTFPQELRSLRSQFNLVTCNRIANEDALIGPAISASLKYFLAPGGIVFINPEFLADMPDWQRIKASGDELDFLFQMA